ncbi:hypothetical protein IGI37_002209 [Enterococcus sp. AZ194]
MPEVFSLQIFDYVTKSVSKKTFFPVLDRVMKYLQAQERGLQFSYKKSDYFIEFRKILYFEKGMTGSQFKKTDPTPIYKGEGPFY